jgi:hypothetical protein
VIIDITLWALKVAVLLLSVSQLHFHSRLRRKLSASDYSLLRRPVTRILRILTISQGIIHKLEGQKSQSCCISISSLGLISIYLVTSRLPRSLHSPMIPSSFPCSLSLPSLTAIGYITAISLAPFQQPALPTMGLKYSFAVQKLMTLLGLRYSKCLLCLSLRSPTYLS